MRFNKYLRLIVAVLVSSFIMMMINYEIITVTTRDLIFKELTGLPVSDICLIPGTPKYLPGGGVNRYYQNRIISAIELYKSKKVSRILISGDTLNKYRENEVELMKNDLMDKGISDTVLICDRNGISTMNSIRNLNKFKGEKFIIVSQKFHLERALYISGRNKTEALGYIADGSPGFRLKIRELLARLKMQAELMLY